MSFLAFLAIKKAIIDPVPSKTILRGISSEYKYIDVPQNIQFKKWVKKGR